MLAPVYNNAMFSIFIELTPESCWSMLALRISCQENIL